MHNWCSFHAYTFLLVSLPILLLEIEVRLKYIQTTNIAFDVEKGAGSPTWTTWLPNQSRRKNREIRWNQQTAELALTPADHACLLPPRSPAPSNFLIVLAWLSDSVHPGKQGLQKAQSISCYFTFSFVTKAAKYQHVCKTLLYRRTDFPSHRALRASALRTGDMSSEGDAG